MQHDFILLDRSGSMSGEGKWEEALKGINAYVEKLAKDNVDTGVTLAVFDQMDNGLDYAVIRDRIIPSTWKPVSNEDAVPRGWTPLNDAVGRMVASAKAGNYDKVAIIIVTDGHENSSKELTVAEATKLLDECRARGWQVIFLGANYDNAVQAASLGNTKYQTLSAATKNFVSTMRVTAEKRMAYGSGAAATMSYSDDEKEAAKQQ
jgi:uncharacterized protein with von Willebrand factor type A (vWA) domain